MRAIHLPANPASPVSISDLSAFPPGPLRDQLYVEYADDPTADLPTLISRAASEAAEGFETSVVAINAEIIAGRKRLAELSEYLDVIERQLNQHVTAAQAKTAELKLLATAARK